MHEAASFSKANDSLAINNIPCILRNLMIHYHVHQGPSPVQTLSQINPLHNLLPYFVGINRRN
jgi:hypothetical protein